MKWEVSVVGHLEHFKAFAGGAIGLQRRERRGVYGCIAWTLGVVDITWALARATIDHLGLRERLGKLSGLAGRSPSG